MNSIYRYRARIERDLKTARETLKELQNARVKMFEHKIKKAKEFNELSMLGQLQDQLGEAGFTMFAADVTNEPNPAPPRAPEPTEEPKLNREQRRRLEAINRKEEVNRAGPGQQVLAARGKDFLPCMFTGARFR